MLPVFGSEQPGVYSNQGSVTLKKSLIRKSYIKKASFEKVSLEKSFTRTRLKTILPWMTLQRKYDILVMRGGRIDE